MIILAKQACPSYQHFVNQSTGALPPVATEIEDAVDELFNNVIVLKTAASFRSKAQVLEPAENFDWRMGYSPTL